MKPKVNYLVDPDNFIHVGCPARVHATNHPRLGNMKVISPYVLSYDENTGVFETLYEIYQPEGVE